MAHVFIYLIKTDRHLLCPKTHRLMCLDAHKIRRYVPFKYEVEFILEEAHQSSHFASIHLGRDRTFEQVIRNEYYWNTLQNDIVKFIKKCRACSEMVPNFLKKPSLAKLSQITPRGKTIEFNTIKYLNY